jgi:hypothetical protein
MSPGSLKRAAEWIMSPDFLKGVVVLIIGMLIVTICGISLWVWWWAPKFTVEAPSIESTDQVVQNYQVLATVWRAQTTEVYQAVVINGLLETLKLIVTGILGYALGQPVVAALSSAVRSYSERQSRSITNKDP